MKIDLTKIEDIEFDGIDTNDYPDFVDSYITAAVYKGRNMTGDELDLVNEVYRDFVYEKLLELF